jgi:hypothetical protein
MAFLYRFNPRSLSLDDRLVAGGFYDNAATEALNSLYEEEIIEGKGCDAGSTISCSPSRNK